MTTVSCDLIYVGDRLRGVSEAQIESLVESIAEIGVLSPITVYRRKVIMDHVSVDGYGLVAGLHRLESCRRLGLAEIPAQIVDLSELQRQIAECDENLCGTTLSKAERALFTRRRKEAYEALHPETKVGATGRGGKDRKLCDLNGEPADRFTADTAKATGRSERAVQMDAERGDKVASDVLAKIAGTPLDKGTYIDSLKVLSPEDQHDRVNRSLAALKEKEKDESRQREAVERKREAKEAKKRAKIAVCDFLLDALSGRKWDQLVGLLEDAGGGISAKDLREWQAPMKTAEAGQSAGPFASR